MDTIKRRRDFLAAARAGSWATRGAVVQARNRADQEPARVGFTVTKKLGNAVCRNRIKRRLRSAAQIAMRDKARDGFDYVVIGRAATASRPFEKLVSDIDLALEHLNKGDTQAHRPHRRGRGRQIQKSDRADPA